MRRLVLEWKQMGWAAALTPLLFLAALLYASLVRNSEFAVELNESYQQMMLTIGGGWLPLLAIGDYFSDKNRSYFLLFRDFRPFFGMKIWVKWTVIALFSATLVGFATQVIIGFVQPEKILYLLSQVLWMAALSYGVLAWTKEFGWTALVLFIVCSGAFLSQGMMLGPLNYYLPPFSGVGVEELRSMGVRNTVWSVLFFSIGVIRHKNQLPR